MESDSKIDLVLGLNYAANDSTYVPNVIGYKYNVDFTWDETFKKLEEVGVVINKDGEFTINELASATVSALSLKMKDSKLTLLGNVSVCL